MPNDKLDIQKMQRSFPTRESCVQYLKDTPSVINDIQLIRPTNTGMKFQCLNTEQVEIYKYFLSIIIFIISLLLLSGLLSLNGINMESSFKLSILTLMNTVNSSMFGLSDFDFNNLHFFSKFYLILFMIIGRVELLTFLIICKKFLFKS